jgi:hypothetical protein
MMSWWGTLNALRFGRANMDITNTPSRVELAVSPLRADIHATPGAVTGQAETKNPVTAPDKADTTRATRHHDQAAPDAAQTARAVKPLDMFQVGDNDDIPPPPAPPRPPLAMLAMASPDPVAIAEVPDAADDAPLPGTSAVNDANGPDTAPAEDAKPPQQPATAPEYYQSGAPAPVNRTVDIRR